MRSRKTWQALVLVTGLSVAGAALAQTAQPTPKSVASPKAKVQSETDATKLRVEGTVTQVGGDWFEIEVLRNAKASAGPAVGSRIRILRVGGTKIWRDGTYLRDGILRVGEKVQIAGSIASAGTPTTYTAKIVKVVQTAP